MDNGLYAATTGMLTRSRAIDVTANNMANAGTAGFKKDGVATEEFGAYLTYRLSGGQSVPIGTITRGSNISEVYTRSGQGALETTGKNLDLAILGEGYFTLQREDGSTVLTRNGAFMIDDQGYLADAEGNLVLGQNGPIQVGGAQFTVYANGAVENAGGYIGTLRITVPQDPAALTKLSDSLYVNGGGEQPFSGQIYQGRLERSNVDVTEEMAAMIESSRAYQSCSQIVRMLDQIYQKTVNEVGRV